ncbi:MULTISPECIES: response regulator [unclassified Oceanispirochaeta]|uniref:response regulator n=1 Tax=unclassified Oceanispirochaeta TaxID=2635722 RepID=UPI00131469F9|nr:MULTISPECIES: response regulator [unclassified Oceanispirochaeta]MBF9016390.1 response regulator [Oceanispirochaeta sp. M2]NPD72852.1 response regulator [Oceanispirochaeta sp. M1]
MEKNPRWLLPAILLFILITLVPHLYVHDNTGPSAVEIFAVEAENLGSVPGVRIRNSEGLLRRDLRDSMTFSIDNEGLIFMPQKDDWTDPDSFFFQSFQQANGKTNWGVRADVCWFRIILHSDHDEPMDLYASNLVDHIKFTIPSGGTVLLFYRLQYSDAGIVCKPSISDAAFHERLQLNHRTYISILLGLYLGLFLYNLFLAVSTRDSSFPPYLASLFFFSCYMAFRQFNLHIGPFGIASAAFILPAILCLLLFIRNYLCISPKQKIIWFSLIALLFIGMIAQVFKVFVPDMGYLLYYLFLSLLAVYAVVLTVYQWQIEWKRITFFILSWLFPMVTMFLFILQSFELVEFREGSLGSYLGSNPGVYLVIGIQMLLFALSLGNGISEERNAKVLARKESVKLRIEGSAKQDILLHITHEIRSILTMSSGLCEGLLLERMGHIDQKAHKTVVSIQDTQHKLCESLDLLLLLTSIQVPDMELCLMPAHISVHLKELSENYRYLAESKKINYRIDIKSQEKGIVEINKYLFDIMIDNLLTNAIKFTPEGEEISLSTDIERDEFIITIQNSGPGIPLERRDDLFEKMTTQKNGSKRNSGFGLGLYMVRQSVQLLKGTIKAEQTEKFAIFTISLPLSESYVQSDENEEGMTTEIEPLETLIEEKSHILLLEDNQGIRNLIISALREQFKISAVENGLEALIFLDENPLPDLILSDVVMPKMDGITFFKKIRQDRSLSVPVIFLSAVAKDVDRKMLMDMGAVDFLKKPLSLETLLMKIRNLLLWKDQELQQQKEHLKSAVLAVFDQGLLQSSLPNRPHQDSFDLSQREKQVLEYLFKGLQDKEIAHELGLATSTVSNYLQRIYRKTGASNRSSLIRFFYED